MGFGMQAVAGRRWEAGRFRIRFCGRASRTYRGLEAAHEDRKESRPSPGFWPGIAFNEVGKSPWEKIWGEMFR